MPTPSTPTTRRKLVIDARPRGPNGPLAGERIQGRPVLQHLLDLARSLADGGASIAVHARADEQDALRSSIGRGEPVRFLAGPPPEGSVILRADRLYDPRRLRRVLRNGRDPESAVIWRLDRPEGLRGAEEELVRRQTYQPLGRFWALAPARALARLLRTTRVRPNALTVASGTLVLLAAALVGLGIDHRLGRVSTALALALALVLDTADGHLARLQGTASEFGRWLDANLDELGDMALHAAIAWAGYARTGSPQWLVLGMVYAMGKYQYIIGTTTGAALDAAEAGADPTATVLPSLALADRSPRGLARRLLVLAGHADVRWHLWIALAASGRLDIALVAYAIYFPLRTCAGVARKVARHA